MAQKKDRELEIFYRLMTGNGISIAELAEEYDVSTKSISRDITEIKNFIADHRGLLQGADITYVASERKHYLNLPQFLGADELFAIVKLLIGSRALSKTETLAIIGKLKQFTTPSNQQVMNDLISNEVYHFNEVKHDCPSLIQNLWNITGYIEHRNEITIRYYKMNREYVERKVRPIAITFSDFYFYMIGYQASGDDWEIRYYRVDRIVHMVKHRTRFDVSSQKAFDEGDLMNRIQLMFPGKSRHIRFEFTGPSVQAILDKIPTAKVVEIRDGKTILEADVIGTGINMFLLSQGVWVKALAPQEFVDEMKTEIRKMMEGYE